MPKENTHLLFAEMLIDNKETNAGESPGFLMDCKKEFYIGSILPDAFYYHPLRKIESISDKLHGRGENVGALVFDLLKGAKERKAIQDCAFIMGYLSHWSLDRIFHPVVEDLCGDYHDPDPKLRSKSVYYHRLLETALDQQVNRKCYLHEMIDLRLLRQLSTLPRLAARMNRPESELRHAFQRQKRFNRMFMRTWAYVWANLLHKVGIKDMETILPLFYAHLKKDRQVFPDAVYGATSENRESQYRSIENLFQEAEVLATRLLHAAEVFFFGFQTDKDWSKEWTLLLSGSV